MAPRPLNLTLALWLLAALAVPAQTPIPLDTVRVQHISTAEREATTLDLGVIVHDETDPAQIWIGDGATAGGLRVNPAYAWDHQATQDIVMHGNRLQLGEGYALYTLGGWSAISGTGELAVGNGVAQWALNGDSYIRLSGGVELLSIADFSWDNATTQFVFTVSYTNAVTIQHTEDLISPTWADQTPNSSVVTNNTTIIRIPPPAEAGTFRAVGADGDQAVIHFDKSVQFGVPLDAETFTNWPNYQTPRYLPDDASSNVVLSVEDGGLIRINLTADSVTNLTIGIPANTSLIYRTTAYIYWEGSDEVTPNTNDVSGFPPNVRSGHVNRVLIEYTPWGGPSWP